MGMGAGHTTHTDFQDNSIVGYLEYLPPEYNSTTDKLPLIIFLHGAGARSASTTPNLTLVENEGLAARLKTDDIPFIVISPQVRFTWNSTADNLDAFLDFLIERDNRIDPERVYLTGLSDGGKGVFDFPLHYKERIAAIVPVSTWPSDSGSVPIATEPFSDDPAVPIWGFHGNADTYSAMQVWIQEVVSEEGIAQFTLLPGGHSPVVWDTVYSGEIFSFNGTDQDIFTWMLSYSNPEALNHVPMEVKPNANLTGSKILAYEGFDIDAGSLAGNSGITSSGWSDVWMSTDNQVVDTGLNGDFPSVGGALSLHADASGDVPSAVRKLTYRFEDSGSAWISLFAKVTSGVGGSSFLSIALTDNEAVLDKLSIGVPQNETEWAVWGSLVSTGGNFGVAALSGVDAVVDEVVFLAVKIDFGAREGTLWVDPDSSLSAPQGSGTQFGLHSDFAFDQLAISFDGSGQYVGSLIDEIRIGTSFAAVTNASWGQWPLVDGSFVNTSGENAFLGWLFVDADPWVYSYRYGTWIYFPSPPVAQQGAWGYPLKR